MASNPSSSPPQWDEFKLLQKIGPRAGMDGKSRMAALVLERQQLTRQKKEAEARIAEINDEIGPAMEAAGVAAVECEGWRVSVKTGRGASRIVAERLAEKGVPVSVIQWATVPGKEYRSVEVKRIKKGDDDGGEDSDGQNS